VEDLTTTQGIVALAAGGLALLALIGIFVLSRRVHRLRADQRVLVGEDGTRDLIGHAASLERDFAALHEYVEDLATRLNERMNHTEERLDGAIAYLALVRYDAYGELSGKQSTSIALLDAVGSGLVLSTIHHRDQARLYTKQIRDGQGEHELSPEEAEAVQLALESGRVSRAGA
jgi:hypothetical protein